MTPRDQNLQWMKDILDHLQHCRNQLAWAQDDATIHLLSETMLRDLERGRRLCEEWSRRSRPRRAS